MRREARGSELERVGRELRPMMPWLHSDEKVVPE
jgi:ketol-acid reductoisomerase